MTRLESNRHLAICDIELVEVSSLLWSSYRVDLIKANQLIYRAMRRHRAALILSV